MELNHKGHTSERKATQKAESISQKLDLKHRDRIDTKKQQKEAEQEAHLNLAGNVQITRSLFKGQMYCDIRKVYGEKKTHKGVTLSVDQLQELFKVGPTLLGQARLELAKQTHEDQVSKQTTDEQERLSQGSE